jgi:hypothetical protein
LITLTGLKKGKVMGWVHLLSLYDRFLSVRIASTATHMTITIITATIPNSTVEVDAKPVTGGAVGAGVGGGLLA